MVWWVVKKLPDKERMIMLQTMTMAALLVCGQADVGTYPRADLLIEPADWVKTPRAVGRFHILDARARKQYQAGHVLLAIWVDHDTWSKTFRNDTSPQTWSKLVGGLRIDLGTAVVIYDDNGTNGARIWWILRYWGIKDARLLNGGWTGWKAAKGKVTKDQPDIRPLDIELNPQPHLLASRSDLLQLLKDKKSQILDVRSKDEFCGEAKTAKRNGSIPSALHLEWKEAIDPKTKRMKPASELKKLLTDAGINLDRPAVTYCQSGGRAAMMAFTLELMGAKNVRNYYRSWSEWGNDPETPIVAPKK
jgi:thiosulfate/3-mercaptopyruvate sulfurtransferase